MPSDTEILFDTLADLACVIGESPRLADWFRMLLDAPAADRTCVIHGMVTVMVAESEDPKLVRSIALLADPRILRAVEAAIREHR